MLKFFWAKYGLAKCQNWCAEKTMRLTDFFPYFTSTVFWHFAKISRGAAQGFFRMGPFHKYGKALFCM
jgi:hypothetical protein